MVLQSHKTTQMATKINHPPTKKTQPNMSSADRWGLQCLFVVRHISSSIDFVKATLCLYFAVVTVVVTAHFSTSLLKIWSAAQESRGVSEVAHAETHMITQSHNAHTHTHKQTNAPTWAVFFLWGDFPLVLLSIHSEWVSEWGVLFLFFFFFFCQMWTLIKDPEPELYHYLTFTLCVCARMCVCVTIQPLVSFLSCVFLCCLFWCCFVCVVCLRVLLFVLFHCVVPPAVCFVSVVCFLLQIVCKLCFSSLIQETHSAS